MNAFIEIASSKTPTLPWWRRALPRPSWYGLGALAAIPAVIFYNKLSAIGSDYWRL